MSFVCIYGRIFALHLKNRELSILMKYCIVTQMKIITFNSVSSTSNISLMVTFIGTAHVALCDFTIWFCYTLLLDLKVKINNKETNNKYPGKLFLLNISFY